MPIDKNNSLSCIRQSFLCHFLVERILVSGLSVVDTYYLREACAEQGDGILLYKARLTVVVHRLRDVEGSPEPETVSELVKDRLQIQLEKLFKKRVNEQKADIFGLWKLVRQKYPGTFLKYEGQLEKLYAAAEADLEIRCLVE